MVKREYLIQFLVDHGRKREDVEKNIEKWEELEDKMMTHGDFYHFIELLWRKDQGEKLSKSELDELYRQEVLNFFFDTF